MVRISSMTLFVILFGQAMNNPLRGVEIKGTVNDLIVPPIPITDDIIEISFFDVVVEPGPIAGSTVIQRGPAGQLNKNGAAFKIIDSEKDGSFKTDIPVPENSVRTLIIEFRRKTSNRQTQRIDGFVVKSSKKGPYELDVTVPAEKEPLCPPMYVPICDPHPFCQLRIFKFGLLRK